VIGCFMWVEGVDVLGLVCRRGTPLTSSLGTSPLIKSVLKGSQQVPGVVGSCVTCLA
jgi:hypothetical protein